MVRKKMDWKKQDCMSHVMQFYYIYIIQNYHHIESQKTAYDWNKLERKKENDFKADKHGRKDKCTNV